MVWFGMWSSLLVFLFPHRVVRCGYWRSHASLHRKTQVSEKDKAAAPREAAESFARQSAPMLSGGPRISARTSKVRLQRSFCVSVSLFLFLFLRSSLCFSKRSCRCGLVAMVMVSLTRPGLLDSSSFRLRLAAWKEGLYCTQGLRPQRRTAGIKALIARLIRGDG